MNCIKPRLTVLKQMELCSSPETAVFVDISSIKSSFYSSETNLGWNLHHSGFSDIKSQGFKVSYQTNGLMFTKKEKFISPQS